MQLILIGDELVHGDERRNGDDISAVLFKKYFIYLFI